MSWSTEFVSEKNIHTHNIAMVLPLAIFGVKRDRGQFTDCSLPSIQM